MKSLAEFAIMLHPKDNVATALTELKSGDYSHNHKKIFIKENVPAGFKIATAKIKIGEKVFKYGYPIGIATTDIEFGEIIHTHNLISLVTSKQ